MAVDASTSITMAEMAGLLVAALGGKEGIAYILGKRAEKKGTKKHNGGNGVCPVHHQTLENFVTREFYLERHKVLKEQVLELKSGQQEVARDVKEILKKLQF